MFALKLKKRVSRFENHVDAAMEKFLFHHRLLGVLLIFIGMYNNYYFSNRFHVWLDMRRVCGSRKC